MGDVEVYPLISADEYAKFCSILNGDLPATYDEWLSCQSKEIRQFRQLGWIIREIPIEFNEFTQFLKAHGAKANIVSLRNFTIEKDAWCG